MNKFQEQKIGYLCDRYGDTIRTDLLELVKGGREKTILKNISVNDIISGKPNSYEKSIALAEYMRLRPGHNIKIRDIPADVWHPLWDLIEDSVGVSECGNKIFIKNEKKNKQSSIA